MRCFKTILFLGVFTYMVVSNPVVAAEKEIAIFAGGCFWCMEPPFEKTPGVTSVISGYTGGTVPNPSYEQVSAGGTGHTESVQITFDPNVVTYEQLLDIFWHNIDPTVDNRQFCDIGDQYRSAIFATNDKQLETAKKSKQALIASGKFSQIFTEIERAQEFYPAEDYHQNYYQKNPVSYEFYRFSCGRDGRLNDLWGE